jgi:peptide/nickel transport system substrate-binding protein
VLQTGEYDYAWNLQVVDEILQRLEKGGRGRATFDPGGNVEYILLNMTDPWTEVDGERSSAKTRHPLLSDPAVRHALGLLVDRKSVQDHIYGRTGSATGNFLNNPEKFRSKNTKWEFNVAKANQVLDGAGWKRGPDGVRSKDGKKLSFVYQTSINAPRQKTQQVVKQACQKAGIEMELKSVIASVYFSSDIANPDIASKFYADIQMYTLNMTQPDPDVFMRSFLSEEIATKLNKWQGRNITRWKSDEYDKTYTAAQGELDPIKRAALFIRMNDLVCDNFVVIPIVNRPKVQALANKLHAPGSGWDNDLWNLKDWYRDA